MINVFKIKKIGALLLAGFIPTIIFYMGTIYYGFIGGLIFMLFGMMLSYVLANMMIQTPFRDMLEGKGILIKNIDSTGIISPFIVSVQSPYLVGQINGKPIKDVFDRAAVWQMAKAKKCERHAQKIDEKFIKRTLELWELEKRDEIKNKIDMLKPGTNHDTELEKINLEYEKERLEMLQALERYQGGITITITNDDYNRGRFAFFHYPTLVYNAQLGTIVTKDFLSDKETESFARHQVIHLNRTAEELTSVVRDFARHVVETLKPKTSIWQNKWVWIIIIIFSAVLLALFMPAIIDAVSGIGGSAGGAISTAVNSGATITPR